VPVASFTVTKLRWLATHEPTNAKRTAAVCLPHDYLTWRLNGEGLDELTTDRGDASGTGYWSAAHAGYRPDLLQLAMGSTPIVPTVLGPSASPGSFGPIVLGPGSGDNAASALGVGASSGDVIVSIGTSGVVCAVSATPTADPAGTVAGFASATGDYLPLIATINAARVLDAIGTIIGADHDELSRLALSAPSGADGLALVPYFEGERTPNRPDATGALHGMRLHNSTREHLARAAVEGLLCGLADGLDAMSALGVQMKRVILIGGGARAQAVRELAPALLARPVTVPEPGEYVADGAARQAAWVLAGTVAPPPWQVGTAQTYEADPTPAVRARYAEVREMTARQL
jgi:xylulokinase